MPHITLRFAPEMQQAIYEGRKCCTTRNKPKGEVGDTFEIGARDYRIVDIQKQALNDVARLLYRQEGFEHSGKFIMFWKSLHPGDPYLPGKTGYVHWFARIEQGPAYPERSILVFRPGRGLDVVPEPDYCPHKDGCPGSDCCEEGERCARTAGRRSF